MRTIDTKDYDVVVVGSGSAGFVAAVGAARAGVKTAIIERYGMPGGCMTVMGNNDVAQFFAHKKQIIDGIGWEFIKRCEKRGFCKIPDMFVDAPHWMYGVRVNPVGAASVIDEMLLEAGVDIYYHQPAVDVELTEQNGKKKVDSVIISTKNGLVRLYAKVIIDASGDGDICVYAGAEYECGDNMDDHLQPATIRYFLDRTEQDDKTKKELDEKGMKIIEKKEFLNGDYTPPLFSQMYAANGINLNHISGFNGSKNESKTNAEIEARRYVCGLIDYLKETGGDKGIDIVGCSPEVAMRETRRIMCDTYITVDDYVSARDYDDAICYSFYPIDLHRDGDGGIYQVFLTDGQVPKIPLSALTPKGISNMLVAGRCASGDRLANSAFRVKASCMAMGQAAGAAAAVFVKGQCGDIREADLNEIKAILKEQNAIVPE